MRILAAAGAIALAAMLHAQSPAPRSAAGRATVVLTNARVRAYRTTAGVLGGVTHAPGVIVWLQDGPDGKAGRAIWSEDTGIPPQGDGASPIVIVQPLGSAAGAASTGSKPGDAPFTGMSFVPLFKNARVSVLRARMDVGAREGFHTHASDTVVVHLSGGDIEDTANGRTAVNHWKPGDVEFETLGSSHSARNVSHAVDVVLVALEP